MKKIQRHLGLIGLLLRMRLERGMMFRFSFFNAFFVDGIMFVLQLVMFEALYANADSIAGWGRAEGLLFVGTFAVINALNMMVFFFGLNGLAYKVKSGDMDGYLVRPFSPLLRISLERIDIGSVPLLVVSCLIVVYAARQTPQIGVGGWLLYGALVLVMTLLWYDMMLLFRSLAFFFTSVSSIDRLEGTALEMCMKVPGVAFRGVFEAIFMLILPYGLMGTVPVEAVMGTLSPLGLAYSLGVVALFTFLALFVFRQGVRHYKSASS